MKTVKIVTVNEKVFLNNGTTSLVIFQDLLLFSRHSLDSLKAEVHSLTETIASISEKLTQTESEFQQTMAPFIKV